MSVLEKGTYVNLAISWSTKISQYVAETKKKKKKNLPKTFTNNKSSIKAILTQWRPNQLQYIYWESWHWGSKWPPSDKGLCKRGLQHYWLGPILCHMHSLSSQSGLGVLKWCADRWSLLPFLVQFNFLFFHLKGRTKTAAWSLSVFFFGFFWAVGPHTIWPKRYVDPWPSHQYGIVGHPIQNHWPSNMELHRMWL